MCANLSTRLSASCSAWSFSAHFTSHELFNATSRLTDKSKQLDKAEKTHFSNNAGNQMCFASFLS